MAVGNLPDAIAAQSSLVAHWRLGSLDVWRHGGIVDAVNRNASAARLFARIIGLPDIGLGPPLEPKDALAKSTTADSAAQPFLWVDDAAALRLTGDMTLLAVCQPGYTVGITPGIRTIIAKINQTGSIAASYRWAVTATTSFPTLWLGNGVADTVTAAAAAPTPGAPCILGVTVAGTTVTHYLNGVANGSATNSAARADTGSPVWIAGIHNAAAPSYAGTFSGWPGSNIIQPAAFEPAAVESVGAQALGGPLQDLAVFNAALTANDMLTFAVLAGFA